jgi:dCMP deaminase
MTRPSWDSHFMKMAKLVAEMGTCARRQVGCVLVDERHVVLSTGFNGPPGGWAHCRYDASVACPGATAPSGTALDECVANHGEQNALLHCADVRRICTVYCTCSPCVSCVKVLLCTSALRIVFEEDYPHAESRELWTRNSLKIVDRSGNLAEYWWRTWEQMQPDGTVKMLGSSERRVNLIYDSAKFS